MTTAVGIRSLGVCFPKTVRTNDFFRENYPALVADGQRKSLARVWSKEDALARATNAFDIEMLKYADDPFRGTVERRALAAGERAIDLERSAAKRALAAASMKPGDVDLMIVTSFLPDQPGVGNAAYLVKELGLRCPAFNLESACSSALIALETATAIVNAGHYRNVLVVVSCTYTRVADYSDTLAWFLGDGAGAFVVGAVPEGFGLLGQHAINTAETCGTFSYRTEPTATEEPKVRMQCSPETGRILQETAEPCLRACVDGALKEAGLRIEDIDFFIPNTATAWNGAFAARALGIDPKKTISTYPRYANIGPALLTANLHAAMVEGKIEPGARVLFYTIGSVSTASAAVVRLGELGVLPATDLE